MLNTTSLSSAGAFAGAVLTGAALIGAAFTGAAFTGAAAFATTFAGAAFTGADFARGAFTGSIFLDPHLDPQAALGAIFFVFAIWISLVTCFGNSSKVTILLQTNLTSYISSMNNTLTQIIAPSVLNADFLRLGEQVKAVEQGGAKWIHLDIMDGNFVPNISFGPGVTANIRKATKLPLDCHLMIEQPELFVPQFAKAGADYITVHAESTRHLDRLVNQIKECGCKAGVSINPATPLSAIEHVLGLVDLVLIMSVNPGFGGQSLIPYCLEKITTVRKKYPILDIQIDGGVKLDNIVACKNAGANVFVVGSAIFATPSPEATTRELVKLVS